MFLSLLDGGFRFNTKFTPQKLVELAKMDGAIVLSSDLKKINLLRRQKLFILTEITTSLTSVMKK